MNRRRLLYAGSAAAFAPRLEAASRKAGQARMKAGTQHGVSDDILRTMASLGVDHICGSLPSRRMDAAWSVESITKTRERIEGFGLRLEMLPLPLSSSYITDSENPEIMLGKIIPYIIVSFSCLIDLVRPFFVCERQES